MICSKCGTNNEAQARFCESCGAPLDRPIDFPPSTDFPPDDDQTILSSLGQLAEEAKTVSVTQEELAAAEAEANSVSSPFRPEPPPPPLYTGSGSFSEASIENKQAKGWMNKRNMMIIGVIVAVLLLCCCISLIAGSFWASPEMLGSLAIPLPQLLPKLITQPNRA